MGTEHCVLAGFIPLCLLFCVKIREGKRGTNGFDLGQSQGRLPGNFLGTTAFPPADL